MFIWVVDGFLFRSPFSLPSFLPPPPTFRRLPSAVRGCRERCSVPSTRTLKITQTLTRCQHFPGAPDDADVSPANRQSRGQHFSRAHTHVNQRSCIRANITVVPTIFFISLTPRIARSAKPTPNNVHSTSRWKQRQPTSIKL